MWCHALIRPCCTALDSPWEQWDRVRGVPHGHPAIQRAEPRSWRSGCRVHAGARVPPEASSVLPPERRRGPDH